MTTSPRNFRLPQFRNFIFTLAVLLLIFFFSFDATGQDLPLGFSKAFSPSSIGPGSVSTLQFTVMNYNSSPSYDLTFTDNLPAGVTIASPTNANSSCGGAINAPDGGAEIIFSEGVLGGGGSCTISVDVTSSVSGVHTNVSGDLTSSVGNSGPATADLTVAEGRPGFSKVFSPDSVFFGGRSTLTFIIDNTLNSLAATDLSFTDNLPSGMVVAAPSNASTDCVAQISSINYDGGVITAPPGSSVISYGAGSSADFFNRNAGAVEAGASCTVKVDVTGGSIGMLKNSSGLLTSSSGFSGKANAALEVTASDLLFFKSFSDDPVIPGGSVTLDFTIINNNRSESASSISFTDDLDSVLSGLTSAGLPLGDVCGAGSQLNGAGFLAFTGGNLGPGESCTFSVMLDVPTSAALGAYKNTTSPVEAEVGGVTVTGPSASEMLFVQTAPVITKTFLTDPVGAGGKTSIRFIITNTSQSSEATDIAFKDELTTFLPFPVTAVLPSTEPCGAGSSVDLINLGVGGQGIGLTGGVLEAGDSCTFDVTVSIPDGFPGGIYTNTTQEIKAVVDGWTYAGGPASDTIEVVSPPILRKSFTNDPVQPGAAVTLEFSLSHDVNAPGDASNITFTDDLAAITPGLTASGLPLSDVCGLGNGLLTGSSGDAFLTFSGGTLAPGQECRFSVSLNVPNSVLPGNYTNATSSVSAAVSGENATGLPASDELKIAGISFSKSFIDDPVIPGETAKLEFTIENMSTGSDAANITFTDDLNAVVPGLALTAPLPNEPCGLGSLLSEISPNIFMLQGGNLLAGQSCTFSVTIDVPQGVSDGAYLNRTSPLNASMEGDFTHFDPAADALQVSSLLLELTKNFTDDPAAPGGTVGLAFTITNLDSSKEVINISFTDNLGVALPGLAATGLPQNGVCGVGSQITGTDFLSFTGGSLGAGETCTFSVTLNVPDSVSAGSVINTTSSVQGSANGFAVKGDPAGDILQINFLNFTKAFEGDAAPTGNPNLIFTIQNLSSVNSVSGLRFTDDLDAVIPGLVANGLPLTDVCGVGSQISGASFITMTGGSLGPSQSCTIMIPLQVPSSAPPGDYVNKSSPLNANGLPAATPASGALHVNPSPGFTKNFTPGLIGTGQTSTIAFTIDNSASTISAGNLDFTDNLPDGLVVADPPNAYSNCSGGVLTAIGGADYISYRGGTVDAGSNCIVSADVIGLAAGVFMNTTGELISTSGNSGAANDSLTVNPQPGFAKQFTPGAIPINGISVLTFTIDNSENAHDLTDLSFIDILPSGIRIADPPNASTTCVGGSITSTPGGAEFGYAGGKVFAGASCSVQANVTSNIAGVYSNTVGGLASSQGISKESTAELTVSQAPAFAKVFTPDRIDSGGISTLTFTIDNSGSVLAADNLTFEDNLPEGLSIANIPSESTTCAGGVITVVAGKDMIEFSGGSVSAGDLCSVSVNVTSNTSGIYENFTGNLTSTLGTGPTAEDSLSVITAPIFAKSFSPDFIPAMRRNEPVTVVFTIDNTSSAFAAESLSFIDHLGPDAMVADPSNASSSCGDGFIAAESGTNTISYSEGSVPAGQTCHVQVDVVIRSTGVYVNTTENLNSSMGVSGAASASLEIEKMAIPVLGPAGYFLLAGLISCLAMVGLRRKNISSKNR